LYFIISLALFASFTNYALEGTDFLFILPAVLYKLIMVVPSFIMFAWEKKYDIKKALCLWLNCIIFKLSFYFCWEI
jgi:hypothetical protein